MVHRMLWILLALAIHTALLASAQHEPLRVVFHGYTDAQPRTAIAEIVGLRLTNISDLDFARAGGELSPDGTRVAFDSSRKSDRGIDIATTRTLPDGHRTARLCSFSQAERFSRSRRPEGRRGGLVSSATMAAPSR